MANRRRDFIQPLGLGAFGVYFLVVSISSLEAGEWSIFMDPKLQGLLMLFYVFGTKTALYIGVAVTGILGVFCLALAILMVMKLLRHS